ncbi:MAG: hypothetical protein HN509_12325, partial [Halobacteriovoraceae bacterium]|nr:hypothetical protein [Halobacteriovoraceae bacterium]
TFLSDVGQTSGITDDQLHDDNFLFNTDIIFSEANACGAISSGGSYLAGTGSGVFRMEFLPCTNTALGHVTIKDISVRVDSLSGTTRTLTLINPGSAAALATLTCNDSTIVIRLAHDGTSVTTTAALLAAQITLCAGNTAVVSGTAQPQAGASTSTFDITPTANNRRVDVGFRCVLPIENEFYNEPKP